MCSGGEGKQWTCGKASVVSLQKVGSLVRDLSEPCLSQSRIQLGKMLKPDKWQSSFDTEGRVSGFQKALKLIVLGGVDASIRGEVWEFLLGCYALSSTSEYRNQLRIARRKRYDELLKQCQEMHSSVGTGSLAYVVGSKVMDMRKSYRNETVNDGNGEEESCIDNSDNASNNGSESVDLASPEESLSASPPYRYASSSPNGFYDFPSLPVTDLFERHSLDNIEISTDNDDDDDERMHNFRIDKNADLVREEQKKSTTSEIEHVGEDRVSEWLWTLHRIVVDVVRTDSHLEFYEDPGNLGRMSDILAVYAWVDPSTGYCQGMSDLVSPFVVLFEDNADAFWCFEMLIRRTRANFQMEGPTGVMDQLQSLWHILQLTDKDIFNHLSRIGAESLHFAFRMLLVLFRRELSFNEALRMWEMMWAADYDESVVEALDNGCLDGLVIQLPRKSEDNDIKREPIITTKSGPILKSSGLLSRSGLLPKSGPLPKTSGPLSSDEMRTKSEPSSFCGLTRSLWSRNDRTAMTTHVFSIRKGDDALPVFCVAAILIMNRHKIIKETRSIDDMIQIFNDKVLVFRVRRCIRTAMKLRRKYVYKSQVLKSKKQNDSDVSIQHQTHIESRRVEETKRYSENQSQATSLHQSPSATQNSD